MYGVSAMDKEAKKNAYLYCKFRDEQFALYDEYAKRHGMMMKTLLVVNVLFYAQEGMTQRDICRRTFQSKQTVNLIVKNLLAQGYVTVDEAPDDRRIKIVRMTDAGAHTAAMSSAISRAPRTRRWPCSRRRSRSGSSNFPERSRKILQCWSIGKRRTDGWNFTKR